MGHGVGTGAGAGGLKNLVGAYSCAMGCLDVENVI